MPTYLLKPINKKSQNKEKYKKEIVELEDYEIKINEKIKSIPLFSLYFNPFEKYAKIKNASLEEDSTIYGDSEETSYYVILKKEFKYNDFYIFFKSINNPKQLILTILSSYEYLLHSIKILKDNKLCYFDINHKTICFKQDTHNPIFNCFDNCLDYENENILYSNIKNILHLPQYYIWPIEVHLLTFLNVSNNKSVSKSNIEDICKKYILKNRALTFFSKEYIQSYYKDCVISLLNYENMPEHLIIKNICSHIHTWDNYSLSILYLQILNNIGKNSWTHIFSLHLLSNIHPDPTKRLCIEDTIVKYEDLKEDIYKIKQNDWTFMNDWKRENMKLVKDKMGKDIEYLFTMLSGFS